MAIAQKLPPEFQDKISAATHQSLEEIMMAIGVRKFQISEAKIAEVAECLLKDLQRLAIPQGNEIADTKYAAYWAFWVRKIKPVNIAWLDGEQKNEMTDVNERAALELAMTTVKKAGKHRDCIVRGKCQLQCNGASCVEAYTNLYFTANRNQYSEYIVYSMGKRTFGPHHLCAVLDAILFAACGQAAGFAKPVRADSH